MSSQIVIFRVEAHWRDVGFYGNSDMVGNSDNKILEKFDVTSVSRKATRSSWHVLAEDQQHRWRLDIINFKLIIFSRFEPKSSQARSVRFILAFWRTSWRKLLRVAMSRANFRGGSKHCKFEETVALLVIDAKKAQKRKQRRVDAIRTLHLSSTLYHSDFRAPKEPRLSSRDSKTRS